MIDDLPLPSLSACLVFALLTAPLAGAYHYSVGAQDSVGVSPREEPGSPDTSTELYERGTDTDCETVDEDVQDADRAASRLADRDPFCGRLFYHPGTGYEQIAPGDQELLFSDWTFDVVATQYVGTFGLDTCYPWCAPGGVTALGLAEAGLQTIAPGVFQGDHEDEEDAGHQSYALDVRIPSAGGFLQREANLTQGSGWLLPTLDLTFVGFLQDDSGLAVDDQRLDRIVSDLRSNGLPPDAVPLVCGFSPDFEAGGPTEDAPLTSSVTSSCDVLFEWRSGGLQTTVGPGENDRCQSATYACGTVQPAWYGELACTGWVGCQPAHQAGDAWHSTYDYDVWHFVAGPALSECNGNQQPGFRTAVQSPGADLPFLAHDLDVYTPPTGSYVEAAPGELPSSWAGQLLEPASDTLDRERADPARSVDAFVDVVDIPLPVEETYRSTYKQPIPEPNADGDSSKSLVVDRQGQPCDAIVDDAEDVVDPWVNQIDTRQRYWTWNGMRANSFEVYGNVDESQDRNNRPGPGFYLSDGMVGMFTDRDDDGAYDQASAGALFSDIQSVGAYPMFYDMHLDDTLGPKGGCAAGFAQQPIAEAMAEAGYGPRTGLVEAVYLKEPTALLDRRTGEVHEFPTFDNVFVAKSQAVKTLEAAGDTVVEDVIEETIAATGAPDHARIVDVHDVAPSPSDFWEQCGEPTGRYVQEMMFFHDCTVDCSGDTVATTYLFEVESSDGVIGGGAIPSFQPDGGSGYEFGSGVHTWTDVDPFDNDPDRNTRDGTPPH